jgi:hypothetical protein
MSGKFYLEIDAVDWSAKISTAINVCCLKELKFLGKLEKMLNSKVYISQAIRSRLTDVCLWFIDTMDLLALHPWVRRPQRDCRIRGGATGHPADWW